MLYAAIDIGSNAVRLLIASAQQVEGKTVLNKQNFLRVPIRLGKDVYNDGMITSLREGNLLQTLRAYKLLMDVYQPADYSACATAAMREASNGKEILDRIESETGLAIRVINGLEEARIIRNTNALPDDDNYMLTMFVDVGGGSTEISVKSAEKLVEQRSFNIGTLRILSDKVDESLWHELRTWLEGFDYAFGKINLLGSGGNINKLTKLFGRPKEHLLIYNNLKYAHDQMEGMTFKERMQVFNLRHDRADVIVPAAKIFLFIMEKIKVDKILAPKIGLADGLIYELHQKNQQQKSGGRW